MVDGIATIVHRIAQDRAEFARESVRDHGLALDQSGIAETRLFACASPIDENHVTAALLQIERDAHSHHSGSEDDNIRAHAHRALPPLNDGGSSSAPIFAGHLIRDSTPRRAKRQRPVLLGKLTILLAGGRSSGLTAQTRRSTIAPEERE
jgi:hypothetical protein